VAAEGTAEAIFPPERPDAPLAAPRLEDAPPTHDLDQQPVPEPDLDPVRTDLASMLPEPAVPGGATGAFEAPGSGAEQVTDDSATLEALFEESPPTRSGAPADRTTSPMTGSAADFKIRRRSGKVFGPFSEGQIVEMIDKGELLGNEDVSSDGGTSYLAIGAVEPFAGAIRRHTEALHRAAARVEPPASKQPPAAGAVSQRVVQRTREPVEPAGSRATFLRWVALGVLLVVVVAGVGGALTPYGPFFHRLVRGHTGAHRPGAKLLADARARLVDDRLDGAKAAVELADRALRLYPSDEEAKATYAYAVSVLARRHGGAAAAWTRARGFLPELVKRAGDDPEAAKAVLSASLLTGDRAPDAALEDLQRLVAKGTRDGDVLLVLGDTALARGDAAQAAVLYGKLDALSPGSARSSHALAMVALRRGDVAGGQRLLEAALSRDPGHLTSAVALARLALAGGDRSRAESLARRALSAESQAYCGPRERAEARSVIGLVLARASADDLAAALAAAARELEAATREDPEDVEARLALAAFQLERGKADEASAALAPIASAAARDQRVTVEQARVMAVQGKGAEAVRLLDAALAKAPDDARLLYAKGVLAFDDGKQADADRLWGDAARDPAAWRPHLAIARARLQRGDLEGAEKELRVASERAPADPRVLSTAADLLFARRDLAGAEAGYRGALSVDAAKGEPHLGLARIALEHDDVAGARAELRRAVAVEPRLAPAQALYGELLWKARDLTAARKALQAAVALDARDATSRARLGAIELEAGERDAALADLQTAASLDVGSAEIRAWYGRALLAKGETQAAIEQLRKAVELDPRDAAVHLQLGQALERMASLSEAADAYRAVQARAPRMADGYEALGTLYAAQSRYKDALPQLEKAAALAPREPRLRLALADCQVRLGRYTQAIAAYRRVLEAHPDQVALYYKIARAQHEASGILEALPWYERAAREDPTNPMPHYYLGFAYKDRNQGAKAIAAFREYLRARPDAEDRKDIEREIEDLGGGAQPAGPR
jgi:tetratricopeptide (TPR) repeat protein